MKKILTLISAFLVTTGLKAQKTTVQKETVKPVADTLKQIVSQTPGTLQKTQKDWKVAPAVKKTSTEFKFAPAVIDAKKITFKR